MDINILVSTSWKPCFSFKKINKIKNPYPLVCDFQVLVQIHYIGENMLMMETFLMPPATYSAWNEKTSPDRDRGSKTYNPDHPY